MPALVSKSLRDYRRALIGWTVGIGAFFGLYLAFYPNVASNPGLYDEVALAKFPGAMRELMGGFEGGFTSGAGYLQTLVYQLFGPLLFITCAAVLGNRAIARPEESGTLELIVTLPIDRGRLVLERFAALALGLLAVAAVSFALVLVMVAAVGMDVPADRILAGHTGVFLLALLFGALTLTVGAATGRRGIAMAVAGAVAVAGYVIETMGESMDAVSWLRWISPFHYYLDGRPLYEGFPVPQYLVLAGATVALLLIAVPAFNRRDVGV
ncbi:ABC-2 type transport system permease protein [Streptosporangium becharense]|uniref:ABC-2 type transport system permease protein n=1 Tax=Streptosporangium becharense TaxID=1816182 RepID=A0A7W9IKU2_9ACTN|nr:ABC transporter permease subunit [Streptosporangium becharense]MBB2910994.1 ABC-2 type transport system permease protein [Streptosporangium becharense]MBB5821948.1 ABC-2 type transport system permease protein [Streptosporangium becharense]